MNSAENSDNFEGTKKKFVAKQIFPRTIVSGILSRLTIRRMVEFYEQEEGILVASEGLSLYLHEARDSFYDPIRNERVTTLIARDAQIREQIMKTKIDTALGILRETGSIDFEL